DRRVRDLRKALLAVIPDWPRQVREERRWRVVSHAPQGFLSFLYERLKKDAELVFCPAERRHGAVKVERRCPNAVFRRNQRWSNPLVFPAYQHRNVARAEKDSVHGISQQHLAWTESPSLDHLLAEQIGDTNLRTDNQ